MKKESNLSEKQEQAQRRADNLEEGAAPKPVGVYERPERSALSPTVLAAIVIVIALITAVVAFVFFF